MPQSDTKNEIRTPLIRLGRAIAVISVIGGCLAFYQNCAPMAATDQPADTRNALQAPHPLTDASLLTYQQWEGPARLIEIRISHATRAVTFTSTDVSTGQAAPCANVAASDAYSSLLGALATVDLKPGEDGIVCTANMRDSVDVSFVDATSTHFSFSRCGGARSLAARDTSLKNLVRALCPN